MRCLSLLLSPLTVRCVCVLLGVAFLNLIAYAQYRFDHWTADNGLPQNSIHALQQTQDGYLWLTTSDGVVRFDGVRFTVFNKRNAPGISNNRFRSLYEDARGRLWLGTEDGGVVVREQGQFHSYSTEAGLPAPYVQGITGDAAGNLVVLMAERQMLRWADGRFVPYTPPPEVVPMPPPNTRESRVFLCYPAPNDVVCFVGGRLEHLSQWVGLPQQPTILSAAEEPNGTRWLVTAEAGLSKIAQGRVTKSYTARDGLPGRPLELIVGARLQLLSQDMQGALWLTDLTNWQHQLLTRQPPAAFTMPDEIRVATADREGNLWFGTFRNGLFRARPQLVTAYSQADGLTQNNVYPIYEDRQGAVWIGTTKGLFKFQDGRITLVKSDLDVSAITEDAAGRVLVAAQNELWLFTDTRATPYFTFEPGAAIAVLHFDDAGALWFGSSKGLGRLQDGQLTLYTTKDGLAGDNVKAIWPSGGGLWLGTYGGLSYFKDGRFTNWTEKEGLPSRTIRSLYEDSDGVLWIGTYDGGLGRLQSGKLTSYTTRHGLYNDGVFQILEDQQHFFWLSCNRGIYRVSRAELNEFAEGKRPTITSIAYGKSDGMLSAECNGGRAPAGRKTRDGKLWFPTQDGVAVLDPATLGTNPQAPPVVLEDLRIDNQSVRLDDVAQGLRLQPTQENFEIQYTALSFINSENLRFRYQLVNLDHDWVEAGTRRTAYFSHVPPGEYVFRVIAANSDGVWNAEGVRLRVVVVPPFYRTWWFRTLFVLAVLGLLVLLSQYRVRQLTRAKAVQEEFSRRLIEAQEQTHKHIAAELHDSLGQNLMMIKNRAMLHAHQARDDAATQEQFNQLSTALGETIDEIRNIAYDLRPFHLDRLGLTQALEVMTERIAAASGIAFTIEVPPLDGLFSPEAEINLYRVVQEAVTNIARHSQATEARVTIVRETHQLTILISDNGRGLAHAETSLTHPPPAIRHPPSGFGLAGLTERVRLLGGTQTIASAQGQGTTITIKLPLR